jgi:hypothetical protein
MLKKWTPKSIKSFREHLGLNQTDFAKLLGCNRYLTVGEWENNRHSYINRFYIMMLTNLWRQEMIEKTKSGKYILKSKSGKKLSKPTTKAKAVKRLKQVEYFKNKSK